MTEKYNKLVRDNIINIIESRGDKAVYKVLDEDEYKKALDEKLKEEVNEFIDDHSIEEMADVMEVIYTLLENRNISMDDVEKVRLEKRKKNGAFEKRLGLIEIERK